MAAADRIQAPLADRLLAIPGTGNVRDLGGYASATGRTRWRTLLRADALCDLTPAGRAMLAEIGVRTIVDLREPVERRLDPNALDGLPALVRNVPLFGGRVDVNAVRGLRDLYRVALETCGLAFAEAVGALCRPRAMPALVHCSAGKDRTGLVTAIVLSAVGVDDEAVADDYALSSLVLDEAFRRRLHARARRAGVREQALAAAYDAPREVMLETLAHLRETYGGAAAYLRGHGLEPGQLADLRAALIEPATATRRS